MTRPILRTPGAVWNEMRFYADDVSTGRVRSERSENGRTDGYIIIIYITETLFAGALSTRDRRSTLTIVGTTKTLALSRTSHVLQRSVSSRVAFTRLTTTRTLPLTVGLPVPHRRRGVHTTR